MRRTEYHKILDLCLEVSESTEYDAWFEARTDGCKISVHIFGPGSVGDAEFRISASRDIRPCVEHLQSLLKKPLHRPK